MLVGMARPTRAHAPRRDAPRTRLEVEERRAQVLEVALAEFSQRSYDEVSMDDVARAAGISKGLVFHYFPTKRELYAATVGYAADDLVGRVIAAGGKNPLERLVAALDAYLDYVETHAGAYVGLMRSGVGADPDVAAIVDRARDVLLTELTGEIPIPLTPLLSVALRGWIGFVEALALAWAQERGTDRTTLRNLSVSVLVATVQAASGVELTPR